MLDWLRRQLFSVDRASSPSQPAAPPFRWPEEARRLSHRADVGATLRQERVVVFISVDWSGQERLSRQAFAEFVHRLGHERPELGVAFAVLHESSEGLAEWFEALALPTTAATGYGAVVWLQRGRAVDLVPYAAEIGAEGLVRRTSQLWGPPPQALPQETEQEFR